MVSDTLPEKNETGAVDWSDPSLCRLLYQLDGDRSARIATFSVLKFSEPRIVALCVLVLLFTALAVMGCSSTTRNLDGTVSFNPGVAKVEAFATQVAQHATNQGEVWAGRATPIGPPAEKVIVAAPTVISQKLKEAGQAAVDLGKIIEYYVRNPEKAQQLGKDFLGQVNELEKQGKINAQQANDVRQKVTSQLGQIGVTCFPAAKADPKATQTACTGVIDSMVKTISGNREALGLPSGLVLPVP
jgi:hypothetical protein